MEDAGLNENIADHTEVVDRVFENKENGGSGDKKLQPDEAHQDQARWWFASAAFPMIAGTLGPVASAFSICALVKPWRQHILPGQDITNAVFIHDPPWLLAINAVQLVIAIAANLSLLLNMTKRIRFSIAQPITFVGWFISSILLAILSGVASEHLQLQPRAEHVWSQAFYYGIFAAVLYFIVASLMVVTFWGAKIGKYPKDFELTMSQRTLMLQTILFLVYLLVGALVFSHIEGWLYLDAVYWADITLFTVGFGDLPLQTDLGRGLMIPYALIGVTTLGLVIGSIRSLMLDRGKSRLDARAFEKKRRNFIRHLHRSGQEKALEPVPEKDAREMESARRQNEYHMMRKIQDQASRERRWMAMGISTSCWLVLWLVGAKIFQECERPYQGWSYFNGIYFSFQAMTTIGYGDVTPISNAAKAFFVFWSLLALPTLTVLISNAGDTVVKEIRDVTVFLGNITILPGEHGYKVDLKRYLSRLSFGVLFSENLRQSPPGFFGAAEPHSDEDEDNDEDPTEDGSSAAMGRSNDEEKGHPNPWGSKGRSPEQQSGRSLADRIRFIFSTVRRQVTQLERKREEPLSRPDIPREVPKDRDEYLLMLIDEIRRVSQHLQYTTPRQYTYQEWVWYLRLIGHDEGDPSRHRRPIEKPHEVDNHRIGGNHSSDWHQHDRTKWSWIGPLSPLMDTRDEAGWILDKLTQQLQNELAQAAKRRQEKSNAGSAENAQLQSHAKNKTMVESGL
ncbi:voltage-gated potassium channel [Xylaria arbuscula]|nr:voltage-gated potassium channel [Xylaria arbuscula]